MKASVGFLLLVLYSLLVVPGLTSAQVNEDCLRIPADSVAPDQIQRNPDSVAVDTCSQSPTYLHHYSKRFRVHFRVDAFTLGPGAPDSIMVVRWSDINTNFGELRDSFQQFEAEFGEFILVKLDPTDTTSAFESFVLILESYREAGQVLEGLGRVGYRSWIEFGYIPPSPPPLSVRSLAEDSITIYFEGPKLMIESLNCDREHVVKLKLYNARGGEIAVPTNLPCAETISLDLEHLSSGAYILLVNGKSYPLFYFGR